MPLNSIDPRLEPGVERALYYGVISVLVVVTYFGVKFTLFAGQLMLVNGLVVGLVLGIGVAERDRSLAAAFRAALLASATLFVLFVLDDFRMAAEFGVVPGLVRADPGTTIMRLLVFVVYETIIVIVVGVMLLLTGLIGAFIGSQLRPYAVGRTASENRSRTDPDRDP